MIRYISKTTEESSLHRGGRDRPKLISAYLGHLVDLEELLDLVGVDYLWALG